MYLRLIYSGLIAGLCLFLSVSSGHAAGEEATLPQVMLEVNAVQIVLNDEHRDGVDWEAIVSDFHTLQLKREGDPAWSDKKYKVSVGTVSAEDYAVLLEALDTVGKMVPAPQPSVTLTAGARESMEMALGDKSNSLRVDAVFTNSEKGGPKLHLEPFIGTVLKEDNKLMALTLKAQTDVELKDNVTVIIGGITSEQEITKTHKVPVLGNLPIVGLVFRNQGRLMQKTETMVFLTPRFKAVPTDEEK